MRRRHPERGLLPPAEFLSHVERTPLIRALTLHVIAEALAETSRWPQEWGTIGVAVNIPYRSIDDAALTDGILGLLASTRTRPELLTLEISPSGPGAGVELDHEIVRDADADGRQALARRLRPRLVARRAPIVPLAEVKIDGGFVRGVGRSGVDAAIVRNLVALARELGLETVAKGVETRDAWDAVARDGLRPRAGVLPAAAAARCGAGGLARAQLARRRRRPVPARGASRRRALPQPPRAGSRPRAAAPAGARRARRAKSASHAFVDGRPEDGIPQRRREQADDGGADAGDRRLHRQPAPALPTTRQDGAEEEERGQEDRDERDRRAGDAVRRRLLDRAEVRREREQRPRYRLRGAVPARKACCETQPGRRRPRR